MAYIGNRPEQGNFRKCDAITTSATATYNLLVGGVAVNPNQNQCIVSLNGVIQSSGNSYTIASSQITFSQALTSSDVIDFILILGDTLDVGTVSDDTISTAKIQENAVTNAKLGSDINATKLTAGLVPTARLGTGTASSSTFLRGDQTYAEAGGGLVYTGGGATTSSVSAIAINGCFNATYRQYLVVYDITPDTNGTNPRINFRDTSNNNITPSKYGYAFLGLDFGGGAENFSQDNDESALQPGQGTFNQSNTDFPALSGYLWIINPFSATHNVNWHGQVMNRGNNGEDRVYVGSGRLDVQTQCAGLKFFFNSGNVNNATIKVYGLVDS